KLTLYQPGIRSSYVHSYFGGIEHQFTPALAVELNALGSLGRKGITTDIVNRFGFTEFNSDFRGIYYRANQGCSAYHALTAVARFRSRRGQFQLAYTWSHSIDNQSEPLSGDFYDLSATKEIPPVSGSVGFRREFDSAGDRGSSDFDQRHTLVVFSVW